MLIHDINKDERAKRLVATVMTGQRAKLIILLFRMCGTPKSKALNVHLNQKPLMDKKFF